MLAVANDTRCQVKMTNGEQPVFPSEQDGPGSYCSLLERGGIIYYPQSPVVLSESDLQLLLRQKQGDSAYHKNVSFRPASSELRGFASDEPAEVERFGAQYCRDFPSLP